MTEKQTTTDGQEKRNLSVLSLQRALATIGWTMASPAVVLPYLVISLDMPVFLAGALVSIRRTANLGVAMFGVDYAASRTNRKLNISATDLVLALCYGLAVASVAVNSDNLIMALLVMSVLMIGMTEEFQNLVSWDFLADTLQSENRQRLTYWSMALGGIGTIVLTWLAHLALQNHPPLTRHSTVIAIAVGCFVISAGSILLVNELNRQCRPADAPTQKQSLIMRARAAWRQFWSSLGELMSMRWFRKYVLIRIALQTVELSVPFFAILAAISQGGSHKGLTALIISSAVALVVAGPIWRLVGRRSNAAVMAGGALMAALAGVLLIINYVWPIADVTLMHAAALFAVTVAMQGVSNARALYYMDMAPKDYRVAGLAASKSVVRIVGIFLATAVAALAHLQHITWAIALVAGLNLLTAIYVLYAASPVPAANKT